MSEDQLRYHIVLLPEYSLTWITFEGRLDLRTLAAAYEAYLATPGLKPDMGELLDLRGADFSSITRHHIDKIRDFLVRRAPYIQQRCAMVVDGQLAFGLSRMVSITMEKALPAERVVFEELDEALEWLQPGASEHIAAAYAEARGTSAPALQPS